MRRIIEQNKTILLMLIYGILTFPVFYSGVFNGLDGSWIYIINKMVSLDRLKFGRDVTFTYGPLGFMVYPQYINGCYYWALGLYMVLFICQMILMHKIIRNYWVNKYQLYIAYFILFLGNFASNADSFIQYCVLLSLAVLWKEINDRFAVVSLTVSATIAFFFKSSISIALIGACVFFLIYRILFLKEKRALLVLSPVITIVGIYLGYNPSIRDFFGYIRGSFEVASGFNYAMSINQNDKYVFWMFLMMGIYISIMVLQIIFNNVGNFFLMLWVAPSLFMSYKHGYVRADAHTIFGYEELLSEFAVVIMLFDIKGMYDWTINKSRCAFAHASLIFALFCTVLLNYETEIRPMGSMINRIHSIPVGFYSLTKGHIEDQKEALQKIPATFTNEIGNSSFSSYPTEISFIEPEGDMADNFIPLYTLQAYSAYTPYLDKTTASKIGGDKGPEYMIFKFETIDGRIPLIETPTTWKAIEENYVIHDYDGNTGYYLLKKRDGISLNREGTSETVKYNIGEKIITKNSDEIRIQADLSVWGKIIKALWKIPEVKARITYTDGTVKEGRVIMENLCNGITIRGLPYDYDTLYNCIYSNGLNCTIESISFYGSGSRFYAKDLSVEYVYYSHPEISDISYLGLLDDLDLKGHKRGDSSDLHFMVDSKSLTPLNVEGWTFVSPENPDYSLYVNIDGDYYPVPKVERKDAIKELKISGSDYIGYSVKLPVNEPEGVQFILVTPEKYYTYMVQ